MAFFPVLHPMFVHVSAGLLPVCGLFATYAAWKREAWAAKATLWLFVVAALAAAASVATGLLEHEPFEAQLEGQPVWDVVTIHQFLGFATLAATVLSALLLWWKRDLLVGNARWGVLALIWIAVALVVATGWYGGRLVFEYGLNTPFQPSP